MRIFECSGLAASGNVLPRENFVPFAFFRETELCPERMGAIVEAAERALEEPLLALSLSRYRDFVVDGNRSRFEAAYFQRRNRLLNLFFAELYEGKGRFFEALMDTVWAVLEETTWLLPAHNKNNPRAEDGIPSTYEGKHGVALFGASTGACLAFIYYKMKERINAYAPEIGRRIRHEVHERLIVPYLSTTYWWSGENGGRPNNWNPWISSEVLFATALLSEDLSEREAVLARVLRLSDHFVNGYGIDGGCDEGPGYWAGAGLAYITLLAIVRDMTGGIIDLLSHPLVKSIAEYVVKVHISGPYFVNNADCGLRPGVSGASLRFVGACVSSALMLENGAYFDAENPMMNHEGIVNPYFKYLALCMPIPKEKTKINAPLSVYFRDLKIALLRESEDDQVGLCMALKGGTNGESHNHNDIGQLYLYKDGNPIVVDLGGMEYTKKTFSSERYTIMAMRSLYHSTVTPRGYEQLSGAQFASSDEHFDAEARTVSMQLKNSYPAEAGIEDLTRCATLCDGMLTVTDYVAFVEEGEIDIHYLVTDEPIKNADGTYTLAEGVILHAPEDMLCRIEPIAMEDKNLKASWKRPYLYMMHFTKTVKCGTFTFLFCK